MTFGQVDPARLQGEALRRWYLRTPDEIEAERAAAAAQAYDAFSSQPRSKAASAFGNTARSATDASPNFRAVGNTAVIRRDHEYHAGGDEPLSPRADNWSPYVQVAATSPGFWDYWSPRGCANCHGYTPGTLPPVGGQSPFPPGYSPRSGGAGGSSGSQPDRRDKKECDLQYQSDSEICRRLGSPGDAGICWETAAQRSAHCRRPDGTIGFPRLETKGGRRR